MKEGTLQPMIKEWICEGCGKLPCFPGSAVDGSTMQPPIKPPRNCSTYSEKKKFDITRECSESLVLWEVEFPTQYWLSSS